MPQSFAEMIYETCQHRGYDPVYLTRIGEHIHITRKKQYSRPAWPFFVLTQEDLLDGLTSNQWDLLLVFVRGTTDYHFDNVTVSNPLLRSFP